ncbi:MAG: hypothetical protein RR356_02830 [Bacteroidales bacterium]
MKRYHIPILSVLLVVMLFSRCKPELDFTAEYKDITVAYGILNPKDSAHYIKIYKGFLTDGNAIVAAGKLENISYYKEITVTLEESINQSITRIIPLDTTTAIPKRPGIFANPTQVLYYTKAPLRQDATYQLVIVNNKTGKKVTATTNIVNDFTFDTPFNYIDYMDMESKGTRIKFNGAKNAVAYDAYFYFYYYEVDKNTGGVIKHDTISTKINSSLVRSTGKIVEIEFIPKSFYRLVAGKLSPNSKVIRYIDTQFCMQIVIWGAAEDFVTYVDVSSPSSSIVQDRIEYTNMVSKDHSAYGLLSSRNYLVKKLRFSPLSHNEDSLISGSITGDLGFQKYQNIGQ